MRSIASVRAGHLFVEGDRLARGSGDSRSAVIRRSTTLGPERAAVASPDAVVLVRAATLRPSITDPSCEVAGNTHDDNIEQLRVAEITLGCGTNAT